MERKGKTHRFHDEVEWFDSYAEALQVAKNQRKGRDKTFGREWSGDIRDWSHAEQLTRDGWKEGADMIAPSLELAMLANLNTHGQVWKMDVAGFVPCVPSYLAGDPAHMRRKVPNRTTKAPITLVVDIGASQAITSAQKLKRAAAIACFAYYLSVFRAVTVYVTDSMPGSDGMSGYYFPMIKIGTTPMDIPKLAWEMCHTWTHRGLMFMLGNFGPMIDHAYFNGKRSYDMPVAEVDKHVREILGLLPDDIYIPKMRYHDANLDDPVAWAKGKLAEMGYTMDI